MCKKMLRLEGNTLHPTGKTQHVAETITRFSEHAIHMEKQEGRATSSGGCLSSGKPGMLVQTDRKLGENILEV